VDNQILQNGWLPLENGAGQSYFILPSSLKHQDLVIKIEAASGGIVRQVVPVFNPDLPPTEPYQHVKSFI
jgi:hypothetical protein